MHFSHGEGRIFLEQSKKWQTLMLEAVFMDSFKQGLADHRLDRSLFFSRTMRTTSHMQVQNGGTSRLLQSAHFSFKASEQSNLVSGLELISWSFHMQI